MVIKTKVYKTVAGRKKSCHSYKDGRLCGLTKVLKRIKKAEAKGYSQSYIAGLEAKAARLRRKEK